ncbi:MAG: hypothetical protein EXR93_02980 [Gemmatimonadetes bacterium]|nr:hypothetical protein [Gemmatimonadota bacterium]
MIELFASALVAAAAIAFVVEPLTRNLPPDDRQGPPSRQQVERAEQIVAEMAARVSPACSSCGTVADSPALYCARCGRILLGDRGRANSAV